MALPVEIIESLACMPQKFEQAFRHVPARYLRWVPESWDGIPGERFCAADQACHVRDIEIDGYQVRVRRMLQEIAPDLESFDSYALARDRRYENLDAEEALSAFKSARAHTIEVLRTVSTEQLQRRATFGEYGQITLLGLIHFLCSHDQQHLACMQWLLGKIHSVERQ